MRLTWILNERAHTALPCKLSESGGRYNGVKEANPQLLIRLLAIIL